MPQKHSYVPLSESTKAIILGTLLGDGSLKKQKGYQNVRLQFRHSVRHKAYFSWKVAALKELSAKKSVCVQHPDGYSRAEKMRYISRALPALTELYIYTHKQGTLAIRRRWLNQMTPLSLAIWWCDDGSLIGGGRKGVFCTDGFDYESVKVLAQYLEVVWDVHTVVAPVGRKRGGTREQYWRIWIRSQEELKKFLRIVIPHIPVEEMLYKVLLPYKDPQFQQRWISEVASLSVFTREVIERELAKKRKKLKDFR